MRQRSAKAAAAAAGKRDCGRAEVTGEGAAEGAAGAPAAETEPAGAEEAEVVREENAGEEPVPAAVAAQVGARQRRSAESGEGVDPARVVGSSLKVVFMSEWDDEGVFVYQAYCDEIADWALDNQRFGGPRFCPKRMTWIKPSFGWVLYRSGYGHKHGQARVLKMKLSHDALAEILGHCQIVDTNKATRSEGGEKDRDVSNGVVQWDPDRDIMSGDDKKKEPRRLLRRRAIQIGLKGRLSELYVQSVLSIQDVTALAQRIGQAHQSKKRDAMETLVPELPTERHYMPKCSERRLRELGMLPGEQATALARLGRGKAS